MQHNLVVTPWQVLTGRGREQCPLLCPGLTFSYRPYIHQVLYICPPCPADQKKFGTAHECNLFIIFMTCIWWRSIFQRFWRIKAEELSYYIMTSTLQNSFMYFKSYSLHRCKEIWVAPWRWKYAAVLIYSWRYISTESGNWSNTFDGLKTT